MTTAYWCVLIAILLPYACFGIAVNRSRGADGKGVRDNRDPREFPRHIEGVAKRAWNAHLNSFESLPGFAAAVIIAQLAHAPQGQVDALALAWVFARIAFVAFYLTDRDKWRSMAHLASLACVVGIFVVAGLHS